MVIRGDQLGDSCSSPGENDGGLIQGCVSGDGERETG